MSSAKHTVTIYGIKSCDTMKKAFTWLDEHNIAYTFHDYKKQGIDEATLQAWLSQKPWDEVINKRGTTWRKLPDEDKADVSNEKAISLMSSNPSMIKRPALLVGDTLTLGFKADEYQRIFA